MSELRFVKTPEQLIEAAENNLEFFSNSSTENPLFKSVEKQIKSCEKKIEKFQDEYIYLKKIKNKKTNQIEIIENKKTIKNQEDSSSSES